MTTFDEPPSKREVRGRIRNRFHLEAPSHLDRASELIRDSLERRVSSLHLVPRLIGAFLPMADEPQILPLMEKFALAFPAIEPSSHLSFYRATGPISHITNLKQVDGGDSFWKRVELSEIELWWVPARAVTRDGFRLGRGGGHYDRTLEQASRERRTLGMAPSPRWCIVFSFQTLVSSMLEMPWVIESHDEKMDVIVTETEWIQT
jgi:5,10-methenyltetrahydrofolate synthetase